MSADFINGLGARGPQLREAYGAGSRPPVGGGQGPAEAGALPKEDAPGALSEGFHPTSEVGETPQDQQAGEARASQFSSAWGASPSPGVSAGQLTVQGAENTAVPHQVHGVSGGQHVSAGGPEAGFSEATVFKSGPPS